MSSPTFMSSTHVKKGKLNLYWKIFTLLHLKAKSGLLVLLLRAMFSPLMELRGNVNPQASGSGRYFSAELAMGVSIVQKKE